MFDLGSPIFLFAAAGVTLLAVVTATALVLQQRRQTQAALSAVDELRPVVANLKEEIDARDLEIRSLQEQLQAAGPGDPVTGLPRLEDAHDALAKTAAGIDRRIIDFRKTGRRRWMLFLTVDLDDFAQINADHDRATGDTTLGQIGHLVASCARETDLVMRGEDDTFLIAGEVRSQKDMELLAERIRTAISSHRFDPKLGRSIRLTASIGASVYPFINAKPGKVSWQQVLNISGLAAGLAKRHGKNAWICTAGMDQLDPDVLDTIGDKLSLLIEAKKIIASSSSTTIPIPGIIKRSS